MRAGMAKGKQQLKARLEMLLWALTHSNALSPQASRFLRGKGYLYFPKSSSVRKRLSVSVCMQCSPSAVYQGAYCGQREGPAVSWMRGQTAFSQQWVALSAT